MFYEDIKNKISVLVLDNQINIYALIIPSGLEQDMKLSKEVILKNHTEPDKVIKIRKIPSKERIEKEIKKFIKERNNETNRKKKVIW